jgi:hypothetical protein
VAFGRWPCFNSDAHEGKSSSLSDFVYTLEKGQKVESHGSVFVVIRFMTKK